MKTALSAFLSRFKNFPVASILVVVLASFFFMIAVPAQVSGADKTTIASSYYYWLSGGQSKDGTKSSGAWNDNFYSLSGHLMGYDYIGGTKQASTSEKIKTGEVYAGGGAAQEIARLSDTLYKNQPASFIVWAQDQYYQIQGAASFTAAAAEYNPNDSTIYAPGIGVNILQPVQGLWQLSANIVYAFLIVILIVIAFLILLRQPLGGKDVVTIANSLPSIIVTIVLVVFSYALCGLFIDAIYLGSNAVYSLLIGSPSAPGYGLTVQVDERGLDGKVTGNKVDIKNVLQPDDPQMSIWYIFNLSGANVCNRMKIPGSSQNINAEAPECAYSYLVPSMVLGHPLGAVLSTIVDKLSQLQVANGLIELILALAVFQTTLKLFFNLLNSYLVLSFYPVIAPFVFLSGALPGGTMKALDSFFKTLGAATLNFIAIYACFLLLVVFGYTSVDSGSQIGSAFSEAGQIKWVPPLLGYSNKQIFDITSLNNNGANIITSLLVFGMYMAIPNISEMIKKFLEVSSPFAQLSQTTKDITDVSKKAFGTIQTVAKTVSGKGWFGG